jgi:hypothetical protein
MQSCTSTVDSFFKWFLDREEEEEEEEGDVISLG